MSKRTNILLITSDQQHWNTLGKHQPEIKTPNLDRLAAEGMLFKRAYCPNPTCTPTRASLITGQYPSMHGAWALGTKLPESAVTIGEALGREGYGTALIGKAHFQPLRNTEQWPSMESYPLLKDDAYWAGFHGPFYGFEHVELTRNHGDESHVGQHYGLWMRERGLTDWEKHFQTSWQEFDYSEGESNPPQFGPWTLPEDYHMNAWITERTAAWFDRCKEEGRPCFAWASYFDPHPPYLVPEPWASMYDPSKLTVPAATPGEHDDSPPYIRMTQQENPDFAGFDETGHRPHGLGCHLQCREKTARELALYYGMVSMMDRYIGRLIDHLEKIGEKENTLIVFTSDHGHYIGHHGLIAKGPFHYEDGVRVPMIASWPGRIPAGVESDAIQSLVDLPVSFLKAGGAQVPPVMQGVDQLPVWTGGGTPARDHALIEFRDQPTALHMRTYVNDRYKLTVHCRRDYGELYDLREDPGEIRNLWDRPEHRALKAELIRKMVDAEMAREPMWMPRVSFA
ncbi:sulfatase [Verrucomicrobia bacterium LW23]|nr:sulfatase [Verrucomicrobia bacterium LW23]